MSAPPDCPPPAGTPHPPRFAMPPGAIDTHAHLFGPESRYPWSPGRGYTPPDASYADYTRLHEILGVARGVLTQPSVYGTDNSLLLDSLRAHPERLRGIAAVDGTVTDADLMEMDALGVRGIRINLVDKGGMPFRSVAEIAGFADRIRPLGWHIEFLVHAHEADELRDIMARLPVPASVGHMGYMPAGRGPEDRGFRSFLDLLRGGKVWVKLTGAYRITGERHAPYADVAPIARAVIAANPERIVWGTDWPHPHVKIPMPDDGDLLDMLADWAPDEAARRAILVANPAQLYRFA